MNAKMLFVSIYTSPIGNIKIEHDEHFVYTAHFTDAIGTLNDESPLYRVIKSELDAYFSNPNHVFKVPVKPAGSTFQQRVWNALINIPVGQTLTYGDLALKLNSSPRAIGQACKRNPITLLIPCHRIISRSGLGGYMGKANALHYKKYLLEHEKFLF
jgi:methylated-DNA-[protein]-cysteine S-methyltransferase